MQIFTAVSRDSLSQLFEDFLKGERLFLTPVSMTRKQNFKTNFNRTDLQFMEASEAATQQIKLSTRTPSLQSIFETCKSHYKSHFASLQGLRLIGASTKSKTLLKGAISIEQPVELTASFGVANFPSIELTPNSNSLSAAVFVATLDAISFYINCEKSFYSIRKLIKEAEKRNRQDLVNNYIYRISELTRINCYDSR